MKFATLFRFVLVFVFSLTLATSLALAGLPAPAHAAGGTTVVTPASTDWAFANDNPPTTAWSTGFTTGPATPPLGTGSVTISLNSATAGVIFGTQKYQGTQLADIQALSYSTYTNLSPAAMAFQINYDPDVTTVEASTWYGRLVYEPYQNGTVTNGTWQTWDTINGGAGKWWASPNANSSVDEACPQSAPCTLSHLISLYPHIGIRNDALSLIQFKAGSNWNGFVGSADNLTIEIGGVTDTYDFELPSNVYVNASWAGTTPGTDPDGAGPATVFGADAFATIQDGVTGVATGGTVHVAAGTYREEVTVNKSINLLGPNAGIDPNTGARSGEAIIQPVTEGTDPTPGAVCTAIVSVSANGTVVDGFTVDGNNPGMMSGVLVNGVDVDACEGIVGFTGLSNISVKNNIVENTTYTGVDFDNAVTPTATAGNHIEHNLLTNIGNSTIGFGIGVLVYDNFYADIMHNVFTNVRVGIQTGNFYQANPGTTGTISNNDIHAWRAGIFHNLWYSSASNVSVSNNTITAVDSTGTSRWVGILFTSFSVPDTITNNTISAGAIHQQTVGYMVWNDLAVSGLTLSGGTVTNANYGVWVNNYQGYGPSDGGSTAITIDGLSISGATTAGVYVQDDPANSNGATVSATIQNSTISTSAVGVQVDGSDASATAHMNKIAGNTSGAVNTTSGLLNFENNWWGSATGPAGAGSGTGDSVSSQIDFSPWCADAACTTFRPPFPLTVTADNQTIIVGDPDPAFTFTYNGFVNGETSADIDFPPTCGVSGPHSAAGTYPIVCLDGADTNYTFTYVNGTLTVNAVNNPPTDISLSNSAVDENLPVGTTVGTLSTTDPDAGDTVFTYTLINGGGTCPGTDNASFQISSSTLKTNAVFNFATKSSYAICIRTDDGHAGTFPKAFTITVNHVVVNTTATFTSNAAQDGWILESSEMSGMGGALDSKSQTLRVGDDGGNRQYRSILSFNTAGLPPNAVIVSVTLQLKRTTGAGANPFAALRNLLVDVTKPFFGTSAALQLNDFQMRRFTAGGTISPRASGGYYVASLSSAAFPSINATGFTQLRLRFQLDDNNNKLANYVSFYSGNATTARLRPVLVIVYHLP